MALCRQSLRAASGWPTPTGLDMLPYWLLGVAGHNINWDEVSTPQKRVAESYRAPKLIDHPNYEAPLNYAYHFDTLKLAVFLRKQGVASGVQHVLDTVDAANLAEDGSIRSVTTRAHGELHADLFGVVDTEPTRADVVGAPDRLEITAFEASWARTGSRSARGSPGTGCQLAPASMKRNK
jgi:hypothetical protein